MLNPLRPTPAPSRFGEDKVIPEGGASVLSKLAFAWLDPFLKVGFSRPLEKEDLWQLPTKRLTVTLRQQVEHAFYARCPPEQRPAFSGPVSDEAALSDPIAEGSSVSISHSGSEAGESRADTRVADADPEKVVIAKAEGKKSKETSKEAGKYDGSLIKALHTVFFYRWWGAGILKLCGDTLNTTTPLLTKVLLTWLTDSFIYYRTPEAERAVQELSKPRGIGYGIGLAFALFVMQESASLMTNHYMYMTTTTGLSVRTSLVGTIFHKSLRLSGRARLDHSVGQITTMISTDATRLDRFCGFAHNLWVAPIQIAIGIGLLIGNLGYSALVGLGVLLLAFPVQIVLVRIMFGQRYKGVNITDQRVRLTTEVLQGIRLIKFYAWEEFYVHQIAGLRARELEAVRRYSFARASLIALVGLVPVLASVLSFITYALSGHKLNIAIIFSSLQFFNIIRAPLIFFPIVLATSADAFVALGRISKYLTSEDIAEPYTINSRSKYAINVDGDFRWETAYKSDTGGPKFNVHKSKSSADKAKKSSDHTKEPEGKTGSRRWFNRQKKGDPVLPTTATLDDKDESKDSVEVKKDEDRPFELTNLKLKIPKGSFVAIVGRVGSGKSSLLQALIGEMRRTRGESVFSSPIAYVPQTAWIMNATLRENILFGREDDEERLREIIKACCLEHDLEMLPNGEDTEIGEKGINLSGGQKARVSLARAAYSEADIILMDDSLSAVDAYVGKAILENCLLTGPLADKTRVLVTHALHVLDKADYIYVMEEGVIVEQGTYLNLMSDSVIFSRLIEEYGSLDKKNPEDERDGKKNTSSSEAAENQGPKKEQITLMQEEERLRGAVKSSVYTDYFRYVGSLAWALLIVGLVIAYQGGQVANNLFLGFWTSDSVHGFSQGDYMGTYAALGIASASFAFLLSFMISLTTLSAGLRLFKTALMAVLRSPVSFFDTTPMGRIMSRLSKDQDTLDTEVAATGFQLLSTGSSVLGTVALVFYTFPYLGIIFVPLSILYYGAAIFYRRSSVETKRLDSLMRSNLYASYSETLTGLSTVRGYGAQARFTRNAEQGLDMENRAYFMTIAIQRWLGVRLDLLGNGLVLGIALFAAGFRRTVDPSKIGVVLSYTLSITQTFSELVSQYATNEQNFNAAERVLHYTRLPSEGAATTPNDPPPSWPAHGVIEFRDVHLAYREGLPFVLKGVSFRVNAGEKVGIVGRTGAGKSSLLQALFRIVNVQKGSIMIDERDIRDMGLDALRGRLALVPQDSTLFLGTLRENLDPQATCTDAEIISALKRVWLLPRDGSPADPISEAKFSLNASVSDEGSNYSAGEKQLLSLCRALVRNSKVIVLDEATSNVDVETDAKLQQTIQTEFASSTLLCIAHRLNTIVYYDRVIVMDAGEVAEFDTPLNLFDNEDSIFRSLCDEAGLSRQDIVRIRAGVQSTPAASGSNSVLT